MTDYKFIWIFSGTGSWTPTAVFEMFEEADEWIREHKLSGYLSEYPIGISVYDWVIEMGYYEPKKPEHLTPEYMQKFGSAYLKHYHYEDGEI